MLGNFSFGGNNSPADKDTAILQQEFIRYPDGTLEMGELTIIPCSISSTTKQNNFQPTPLEPGKVYDRVLSKLDGSFKGGFVKVSEGLKLWCQYNIDFEKNREVLQEVFE